MSRKQCKASKYSHEIFAMRWSHNKGKNLVGMFFLFAERKKKLCNYPKLFYDLFVNLKKKTEMNEKCVFFYPLFGHFYIK